MNFAISGHPRSGTMFLANIMNRSDKWTVLHEPDYWNDEMSHKKVDNDWVEIEEEERLKRVQERFKDNYGEINSTILWAIDDLKVDKKGIILRHPAKLWVSELNKMSGFLKVDFFKPNPWEKQQRAMFDPAQLERNMDKVRETWHKFVEKLYLIDKLSEKYYKIKFQDMVEHRGYINRLCRDFGIDDTRVSRKIACKKVNAHSPQKVIFKEPRNLPSFMLEDLKKLGWFVEKHELEMV